ncbi:MAG: thioredoxin family protein [Flavobacteriales bacterium]|nr:thioredoxin family protein [Flavobacteriales bacterium]
MKNIFIISFFLIATFIFSQEKTYNLESAKEKAKTENKAILMVFSGSDWCIPCIKLKKSILDSEEFKKYEKNNLVFLEVDFPKRKQNQLSKEQQKINDDLASKYNKDGIFPKVILLDENQKVLGMFTYKNGKKISEYIQEIENLIH